MDQFESCQEVNCIKKFDNVWIVINKQTTTQQLNKVEEYLAQIPSTKFDARYICVTAVVSLFCNVG